MAAHEHPDEAVFSARRVAKLAGVLLIVGVAVELAVLRSPMGALSLTLAGGVAIINFRWLEALIQRAVQADRPQFDRRAVLLISGRMLLFAVMMAALIVVPGIDPVAVALGFSTLVVAVLVEGLRWGRVGGG